MQISIYENVNPAQKQATPPISLDLPWSELVSALTKYEVGPKHGSAWSPITYSGSSRKSSDAVSISALVYDIDEATPEQLDAMSDKLDGLEFLIAETFTANRWRVVLPVEQPVEPRDYKQAWESVRARLVIPADPSGKDLARLFYAPRHPEGETRRWATGTGKYVTWRESSFQPPISSNLPAALDLTQIRLAATKSSPEMRRILTQALNGTLSLVRGARDLTLHKVCWGLAKICRADRETTAAIIEPLLVAMEDVEEEGLDEWRAKALYSYDRAWEELQREDAQRQAIREVLEPQDDTNQWKAGLVTAARKDGSLYLLPHTANIDLILEHDPKLAGIRFNLLKRRIEVGGGALAEHGEDTLDTALSNWLLRSEYKLSVSRADSGAALLLHAQRHAYDPVKEYLRGLKWDGVPRIDRMLETYCHAEGNPLFIRTVSRKFMISAVARGLRPGCQVDTVLTLQGAQGGKKTSFVRALGNGFHVETKLDLHSKDAVMISTGNWLVELSEMASIRRGDVESVRAFITNKTDQIRLPYARAITEYPRRCVFVGTTNSDSPLQDQEGNRRFWVVSVSDIDISAVERDRDQLWAEAVVAFDAGEPWWLDAEQQKLANNEMKAFEAETSTLHNIIEWMSKKAPGERPQRMTTWEVASQILHIPASQVTNVTNAGINADLRKLGWRKVRGSRGGSRVWEYEVPKFDRGYEETDAVAPPEPPLTLVK